jgi:hypothetical protein
VGGSVTPCLEKLAMGFVVAGIRRAGIASMAQVRWLDFVPQNTTICLCRYVDDHITLHFTPIRYSTVNEFLLYGLPTLRSPLSESVSHVNQYQCASYVISNTPHPTSSTLQTCPPSLPIPSAQAAAAAAAAAAAPNPSARALACSTAAS